MKLRFLIGVLALSACGDSTDTASSSQKGYYLTTALWPTREIPVCWEETPSAQATQRAWVESRVKAEFEPHTNLTFIGWAQCAEGSQGIRIKVGPNLWPATSGLGNQLNGRKGGMELSFDFANIVDSNGIPEFENCRPSAGLIQNRRCIENLGIHEFGHAVGMAHEQLRPDTPASCKKPKIGTLGDNTVGAWDIDSVMNYCSRSWNNEGRLSQTDIQTLERMYPTPPKKENEYLVADHDGDGKAGIVVRRGNNLLFDSNFNSTHDYSQSYGKGNAESQYLIGDWDGDGRDNVAVRRNNLILMDLNGDGIHDRTITFGNGNSEDQYLAGDWDGDGKDTLAVRRGNAVHMDLNGDGTIDKVQNYGRGNQEDQYLVGDWDGDGKDNLAVRRGNQVLMDFNFDSLSDRTQGFGTGNSESQYLSGDWDGDGKDNVGIRRGNEIHLDHNFDGKADRIFFYGKGT